MFGRREKTDDLRELPAYTISEAAHYPHRAGGDRPVLVGGPGRLQAAYCGVPALPDAAFIP